MKRLMDLNKMNNSTAKFVFAKKHLIVILLYFVLAAPAKAELPNGISVTVSSVKIAYSASDAILLDVSYTNTTASTIKFLKWSTALEGRINSDFLNISHSGIKLDYIGRHYKRGTPTAIDYVSLSAGETISARVNVNDAYTVINKGMYDVTYRAANVLSAGLSTTKSASNSFELLSDKLEAALKRTPIFASCTAGRQSAANSALSAADSIAARAAADLRATPSSKRANAQRYL